jgi:hypothetical protein
MEKKKSRIEFLSYYQYLFCEGQKRISIYWNSVEYQNLTLEVQLSSVYSLIILDWVAFVSGKCSETRKKSCVFSSLYSKGFYSGP